MTKTVLTDELKESLQQFLSKNRSAELVSAYLHYVEGKYNLNPVLYVKDKTIYQSAEEAVGRLEKEGKIWHETEIKIGFNQLNVNEQTKKIYICPFSGKVFGDNTHPNPQDAIYDWVSKCPENTERLNGLRVKRFYISDDPEVIKNYIPKNKPKEAITKVVYSSVASGKLFNSKNAVIDDFKKNYLKRMSLVEVQSQNKFEIDDLFLEFIQTQLVEDKIAAFIETIAQHEEFTPYIEAWLE